MDCYLKMVSLAYCVNQHSHECDCVWQYKVMEKVIYNSDKIILHCAHYSDAYVK